MESFYKTHFTDEIAKINAPGGLPQLEKSFRMSNEGDVVRASAVYLVNLVNIAGEFFSLFSSKLHASSARIQYKSMLTSRQLKRGLKTNTEINTS